MSETMEVRSLAIVPRTLDEVSDLAARLADSTLLPKAMQGKIPDVLVTIMAGQEMGLAPMASLRAIHVIEGKPVLSADGMIAVILGSGKAVYFERVEESDAKVTYETMRVGAKQPRRCTWTIEMAKRAGLNLKDNWRQYPRAMLASRAKAELARDVYPDVLAGCYTEDEIDRPAAAAHPAYVPPADVIDAEVVDAPSFDYAAEIDGCTTDDELKALAPKLAALPDTEKKLAKEKYQAKQKALREQNSKPVEAAS